MRIIKLTTLFASCLFAALGALSAFADDSETMFPFLIEKGAPDNITNVRAWDGASLDAAGSHGFIANNRGDFYTSSGKTRLMGTNTCFSANFCSHEKADRLAETLSRFGIGVVRLHHMDSRDIWGKNFEKGTTEIDPDQLEKLDYLISRLEERGIYVNINLHVSRAFKEKDGFENADKLPTQNKGVDNFDRRMIELQKKYAKDLLTHVNPYTGKAYVDDPGVAVVEINNENSVVASWSWGQLDTLPEPYAGEFQRLWNEWLSKKYASTQELRDAWDCRSYPFGDEMIDGDFTKDFAFNGKQNWRLELDAQSRCEWKILSAEEARLETPALRVEIAQLGEVPWRPQFHCTKLRVESGKPYQLSFKLRSDKECSFNIGVKEDHDPWGAAGLSEKVTVGTQWQEFKYTFISPVTDDSVRVSFSGFNAGDVVELDLPMKPRLMEANPLVEEAKNQVAVMRGPIVYCLEGQDIQGGHRINDIAIPADAQFKETKMTIDGHEMVALEAEVPVTGQGAWGKDELYRELRSDRNATSHSDLRSGNQTTKIRLIPYYAWDNRGIQDMSLWLPLAR